MKFYRRKYMLTKKNMEMCYSSSSSPGGKRLQSLQWMNLGSMIFSAFFLLFEAIVVLGENPHIWGFLGTSNTHIEYPAPI